MPTCSRVLGTVSPTCWASPARNARDASLWRVIDAGVSGRRPVPAAQGPQNVRVYFEVSRGPYGAGESSFIGEIAHPAGREATWCQHRWGRFRA